jgi:hypothetical protein
MRRYSRGGASALFLTVSTNQQKEQLLMMQVNSLYPRLCESRGTHSFVTEHEHGPNGVHAESIE